MVEVLVRQHNMRYRAPCDLPDIGVDRGGFDEGGAGVDDERSGAALHQADRDVAERQPATMHTAGQRLPVVMHKEEGNPASL